MYEQFYGFSARPFQLKPDPRFYFESASQRKAMACLTYGLDQNSGIVAITGDVGTGKSTLVSALLDQIDRESWTVAQVVANTIDSAELIQMIAQGFGLLEEGMDKAGALAALERFLREEAKEGRDCLLVVDECQTLDLDALDELRMLSGLEDGDILLLQIIALGQPQFRRKLAQHPDLEPLRQRIVASHNLEPMDEREVGQYVLHRLQQVGWPNRPILSDGLFAALHDATGGVPRRVNQVMNRVLLLGSIEEEGELTARMVQAVCEEMASEDEATNPLADAPPIHATEPEPEPEAGPAPEVALEDRTAELEAAISGLQAMASPAPAPSADCAAALTPEIEEAIERIEHRLEEQERSLRHVLTMLIEWLEEGEPREAA